MKELKQEIKVFTLEEFLTFYVFKELVFGKDGLPKQRSQVVRVYYDKTDTDHWFEFAMSDAGTAPDPFDLVLTRKVLDAIVVGFYVSDGKLCISTEYLEGLSNESDDGFNFPDDNFNNGASA